MNTFAMVTTRHSNVYTGYALSSLLECTPLDAHDDVILIDNDGAFGELPPACRDRVRIVVNEKPCSFAANLNWAMASARGRQNDLFFLNNDLIFSRGWFEPLNVSGPVLMSPLSNAEVPYAEGDLNCKLGMNLEDYLGCEEQFRTIVRRHRNRAVGGYLDVLSFPFFAVKIPYAVYSVVGLLDESFGVGGGEDKDYCIRCHQHGFAMRFTLKSYILHFQGKSTWRGAETADQTAARDRQGAARFKEKWGDALYDVMFLNQLDRLPPELLAAHERGDFKTLIDRLHPGGLRD